MADDPIEDSYIVVFKDTLKAASIESMATTIAGNSPGVAVKSVYRKAIQGFSAKMSQEAAEAMADHPDIDYIEQDGMAYADLDQWGLDRIDQETLPLDGTYTPLGDGAGVYAYIFDTGIRTTHEEFENTRAIWGENFTGDNNDSDCNGHGTHVAGTVAGKEYGVAPGATVIAVKVLGCNGSGSWSGILNAMDWVMNDTSRRPAVANMSLGGGSNSAVNTAASNLHKSGVPTAVSAGNSNSDACNASPAGAADVITVGSTTISDARSSFSSWGTCVEIFGPGSSIKSAWYQSDTQYNTISGTSMSSPHVCGGAALLLGNNVAPLDVLSTMQDMATPDQISGVPTATPNLMLYVGGSSEPSVSPRPTMAPIATPSTQPSVSPAPTGMPTPTPSTQPSVSSAPSSVPTEAPTKFCRDTTAVYVTPNGAKKKCAWVKKRKRRRCKWAINAKACPQTCDKCEDFGCEDYPLPFRLNGRGRQWTCEELASKPQSIIDAKCATHKFFTTCRDTCEKCGAGGEEVLVDFDEGTSQMASYYRSDITMSNWWYQRGKERNPGTGFAYGINSDPNCAFNGWGNDMEMTCSSGSFNLNSMYLTAGRNSNTIIVTGYVNGGGTVTKTVNGVVSPKQFVEFPDFQNLNRVVIGTTNDFAIVDDMTLEFLTPCNAMPAVDSDNVFFDETSAPDVEN